MYIQIIFNFKNQKFCYSFEFVLFKKKLPKFMTRTFQYLSPVHTLSCTYFETRKKGCFSQSKTQVPKRYRGKTFSIFQTFHYKVTIMFNCILARQIAIRFHFHIHKLSGHEHQLLYCQFYIAEFKPFYYPLFAAEDLEISLQKLMYDKITFSSYSMTLKGTILRKTSKKTVR